jgi:hypothetical protein
MIESSAPDDHVSEGAYPVAKASIVRMKAILFLLATAGLFSPRILAQANEVTPSARAGIDKGNQAWVNGVKAGEVAPITQTYTEQAVDCGPTGDCIEGRAKIEQHMKAAMAQSGRARSASVSSWGSRGRAILSTNGDRPKRPSTAANTWSTNISPCGKDNPMAAGKSSAIW